MYDENISLNIRILALKIKSGINGNSDSYQPVPPCLLFRYVCYSIALIAIISGLTCKRGEGQFCFVLTLLPRLCAFLNEGIFDSRPNSDDSYMYSSVMVYLMAGLIHRRKNITC